MSVTMVGVAKPALGGGSSAVAASAHAGCERFRGTDPLITGRTRRALAKELGAPDTSGKIPQARWMRAMTFEKLVKDEAFASKTVTTAVGAIGLARPKAVVVVDAKVNKDKTAELLQQAHERAAKGEATLIHQLAVPFVGFEDRGATDVKPDFAVVAPKVDVADGSWLIVGDAKDYERHRSRIDDGRLLKGFLQVAVGAESCQAWSKLPAGMDVHVWGSLAVPRNAFLQPEALVEDLTDHRAEVAMRIAERRNEARNARYDEGDPIDPFVEHLKATFNPASCPSCSLFAYCRNELRNSSDPTDLLIEIGIAPDMRQHVVGLLDGTGVIGSAPASVVANVEATRDGIARRTSQGRIDPIGLPGTVNLVLAKSDAGALAVHGLSIQVVTADGAGEWQDHVYAEPQSPDTRRAVIKTIGTALTKAMKDRRKAAEADADPEPVHIVVPDKMTADVIASIADNLAGLELSRLRWEWDKIQGREQLTFDGEPAVVPPRLSAEHRTAVSFLLDDDRARAMTLRSGVVNAQQVLARHVVPGGAAVSALRLDYVVAWLVDGAPLDHRALADEIEVLDNTPGARLTNTMSDAIHGAVAGPPEGRDLERYDRLVRAELGYKRMVLDETIRHLADLPSSALRAVHRSIESDAQAVWRRRLTLEASDLIRFGRTYRWWRNALVEPVQDDQKCRDQLLALVNPQRAEDLATDAGQRMVAHATVVSADPLILDVASRRIVDGTNAVLLHVNGVPCVEGSDIQINLRGAFNLKGFSVGKLTRDGVDQNAPRRHLAWNPKVQPELAVGDLMVIADGDWFDGTPYGTAINVKRPRVDDNAAPKKTCMPDSYAQHPDDHKYCCKPHALNEAEWSDVLHERRVAGTLNPETWPPVRNDDAFEAAAAGLPQGDPFATPPVSAPDGPGRERIRARTLAGSLPIRTSTRKGASTSPVHSTARTRARISCSRFCIQ